MIFRVARHTNDFEPIINFYNEILGLEILGNFKNHNGYDGIFFGKEGLDWHLEFTKSETKAEHKFDDDDLLVFYPKTKEEFEKIMKNIELNRIEKISPKNPYWKENGILISDPDGFKVVICKQGY
ncbi:MAG: VOC family protein [Calditrichaeota bacterium]|nr:MAG: VOC family protein [Calditrichota bacterium]